MPLLYQPIQGQELQLANIYMYSKLDRSSVMQGFSSRAIFLRFELLICSSTARQIYYYTMALHSLSTHTHTNKHKHTTQEV